MVINDAGFFGSNTLFGQDGIWSSIPTILDNYYKYDSNNTFLSMNIGYGSDLSLSYTIHLLSKIYHFIPLSMIVPTIELLIALGIGFCGLNITRLPTVASSCYICSMCIFTGCSWISNLVFSTYVIPPCHACNGSFNAYRTLDSLYSITWCNHLFGVAACYVCLHLFSH